VAIQSRKVEVCGSAIDGFGLEMEILLADNIALIGILGSKGREGGISVRIPR
jgi:hypothetical protein